MTHPPDTGTAIDADDTARSAAPMAPGPRALAGRRAARGLATFVALAPEVFGAEHWGLAPLLTRADELPPPTHGFGPDAVDVLLSSRALRTPFLRMARAGRTLDAAAFTLGGGVGASVGDQVSEDKVLREFAAGATIVLQALHRTWEPVASTARELAAELGHPVQVNAYVTPPQNRGFDDHYDVHDVLVVQVAGEKHWRVRPPVLDAPLRTQPWTDRREAVAAAAHAEPVIDAVLRPGDCLYLPRGWLHSATALGGVSTHLTFGIHTWTVRHLVDDAMRAAGAHLDADPAARAALPLGVDVLDPVATASAMAAARAALHAAVDAVRDEELARPARCPGPRRPAARATRGARPARGRGPHPRARLAGARRPRRAVGGRHPRDPRGSGRRTRRRARRAAGRAGWGARAGAAAHRPRATPRARRPGRTRRPPGRAARRDRRHRGTGAPAAAVAVVRAPQGEGV